MDTDQVKKIAHLARIAVDEAQLPQIGKAITGILDFVGQMSAVDVSAIEPMAHPLEINQPLRKDIAVATNQRDEFQSLAPASEQGHYLVPKVID